MRAGPSFVPGSAPGKEKVIRKGDFSLPHLSRQMPVSITSFEEVSPILKGN